ncbi:hypothetical protein [Micromonospora sp. NPDC051296]
MALLLGQQSFGQFDGTLPRDHDNHHPVRRLNSRRAEAGVNSVA